MKKLGRLFLTTGLATTLFLGYSLAKAQDQTPPADNQSGDHPAMMDGDHGDGDRMEHLTKKLDLTDDQATKLKALFKKNMEANKPLRDQEKIDMDTLQQRVDTKASGSDIKDLLDKLLSDRKQLQAAQDNFMDKIRTILNPTQQAKWVLSMHRGPMDGQWGGKKGDWKKHKKDGGDNAAAKSAPDESTTPASAAQ